jgi:hypothetical protein
MSGIAFQNVGGLKPGRTRFDWHYEKKFDCEFGQLIPIFFEFMLPGDYFRIANEILTRCTPLVAPVMHEVTIDTHYFFIPLRIMDDTNSNPGCGNPSGDPLILKNTQPPANRFNFQLFITGGFDGQDAQTTPRWTPSGAAFTRPTTKVPAPYKFSLWDYFDLPVRPDGTAWSSPLTPSDWPRRAYNLVWNEYYRDETLQDPQSWRNEFILNRAWRKDYFTSALPFQQRGIAPALPINISIEGLLKAVFNIPGDGQLIAGTPLNFGYSSLNPPPTPYVGIFGSVPTPGPIAPAYSMFNSMLNNNNTIDPTSLTANATTFDVSDLREVTALQKWMERNARAGVRYIESLYAHWGTNPRDERLYRPEYVGGTKTPLIISEVLQTSQTNSTPQGNMAGHGISAAGNEVGSYHATEHGYILGLMSIMPRPSYCQGIRRDLLYTDRMTYPWPEFVNLSEQDIVQGEIYIANNATDTNLFGYNGRYDELRTKNSTVCGSFRDTLNYWSLTRMFQNIPYLNDDFIQCKPENLRNIFAVQSEPGLLCEVVHNLTGVRPIPEIAEPGLLDHH